MVLIGMGGDALKFSNDLTVPVAECPFHGAMYVVLGGHREH